MRIQHRTVAFYQIVKRWLDILNETIDFNKQIFWQDVPGYRLFLKVILIQLKELSILEYPDALI